MKDGIVDAAAAAKALKSIGYRGLTVLEIITDAMNPKNTPDKDTKVSQKVLAVTGWEALTKS
jgi:L-ribulose-5-phosphate 3-epimerase